MKFTKVQTPRGAKDILPPDGFQKSRLESQAAAYLESWGYARVYTPTFEFYDALVQGNGPEISDRLYRFVDRDGHTLALRPEMTIPIARMAATRYTPAEMPVRLHYVGNVFRYDEPQAGRQREFTQVGVELLGAEQPAADAEVVVLAVKVLQQLGLRSFRVDLGHIGYIHSLLQEVGDEELAATLRQTLLERDYVKFEGIVRERVDSRLHQTLLSLPMLRGGVDVIEGARSIAASFPRAVAALDELLSIYKLVVAYGLEKEVAIDLGVIKDFNYYTGLLLEGYTPELGFTLCTGGRYDTLVGRFGEPCPATGFAFGVERAMIALARQGCRMPQEMPDVLLYTEDAADLLFAAAAALRAEGLKVELGIECADSQTAMDRAKARGIAKTARVRRTESGGFAVDSTDVEERENREGES